MGRRLLSLVCSWCGKDYQGRLRKGVQHPCCSPACVRQLASSLRPPMPSGEANPNWKGGISQNHYHYKKIQVQRHPERVRARRLLKRAIEAGKVQRGPCEVCGQTDTHGHHHDYGQPLAVSWLCREHHRALHKALGTRAQ